MNFVVAVVVVALLPLMHIDMMSRISFLHTWAHFVAESAASNRCL